MATWRKIALEATSVSFTGLTLTSLSAQSSELTALTINASNQVGTRELGTAAFSDSGDFISSSGAVTVAFKTVSPDAGQSFVADSATDVLKILGESGQITTTGNATDDSVTISIDDSAISHAKYQDIADDRILGNVSGSAAAPSELTAAQIRTLINVADGAQVNVGTNLTDSATSSTLVVNSSTGSNVTLQNATDSLTGVVTAGTQTFGGDKTFADDVIITGDLTVNGSTTTINTATLTVEDKLIKLADVSTPTTTTANGAGIQIEASATEAEWPELKWSSSGELTGWTLADYVATSNTDYSVAVMKFDSTAGIPGAGENEAGVGSLVMNTADDALYLRTA